MPGCSDILQYSRCPGAIPQHRITPRDAEAGADPTAARGAPLLRCPLCIPYLSPEPTPGAALSPPQCPRSPFPTPLPSAPPPRVMSAQPGPRSLPSAPSTPRSLPSHPAAAAASLPSVATATAGESHPLLFHLPGPRLVSPTAALPKEAAGRTGRQQGTSSRERPMMVLWLVIPGMEGRAEAAGGSGLRANRLSPYPQQFHPCPLSSSHLPTPSIPRSQAVLCSSAPRARSFGAVHMSTVMAQTPHRHLCSGCSSPPHQGQRSGY